VIIFEQVGKKDILIRGRNKDGTRYEKQVSFLPYFYNDKKEKVVVNSPKDVVEAREKFPHTYEADVHYPQRYIIDKCTIPLPDEPLRICYFDIETNGSLDIDNTPEPIICIVAYDSILKKYVEFVWRKDLTLSQTKGKEVSRYTFDNEREMLKVFIRFIQNTDPDIISGFNIEASIHRTGYDLYYFINRCRLIGVDYTGLSPFNNVRASTYKNKSKVIIKGRVVFDLIRGYQEIRKGGALPELPSYSLDYIVQHEGIGKKKEIAIDEIWDDVDKLVRYCRHDVKLCVDLDKKKKLISAYNNIRKVCGCPWNAVWYPTLRADALMIREANRRDKVLATKVPIPEGERYKGAFVLKTQPGMHEGVVLMDLKSLYPSIIQQFNISFDTISKDGDIKLPNVTYKSKPTGIIPAVITYLYDSRERYKKERSKHPRHSPEWETYDMLQFAAKVNMNSMYGVYGSSRSRIYNRASAETIPVMGREIIKWSIKFMEEQDYEVIYGDTDSIFVKMDAFSFDSINDLLSKLNTSYEQFAKKYGCKENKYLQMDFKGVYDRIVFTGAKKKYIGRLVHDETGPIKPELDITGFEIKRSDFSLYGKHIQQQIFEKIMDGCTRPDIDEYLSIKKREMEQITNLEEIVIPKTTTRDLDKYVQKGKQAFLKGAEFANRYLGTDFKAGSKMKFIYIKQIKINNKWVFADCICYNKVCPEVKVNWAKMIDITIDKKAQKIYEAMGWGKPLKGTHKTVGEWMK